MVQIPYSSKCFYVNLFKRHGHKMRPYSAHAYAPSKYFTSCVRVNYLKAAQLRPMAGQSTSSKKRLFEADYDEFEQVSEITSPTKFAKVHGVLAHRY